MSKKRVKKHASRTFRVGRSGACEALLYEFRQKVPAEIETSPTNSSPLRDPLVMSIAAQTLEEALAHLRQTDPHFVITSATSLGLIRLVSGASVD